MKLSAPDFWWRRHSPAGYALAPLGALYGRLSARRMAASGTAAGVPIICVGNLVVGGAGKTPTAIQVASACRELGLEPGFLTRGYRGAEAGPAIVSPTAHTAWEVGDEALLLAQHGRTVVARCRPSGADLLVGLGVDVIVMDDGFQNPSLVKDLSLVVVDGRGVGNGFVLPAGPLRAPLAAQIRHAGALVLLGEGRVGSVVRLAARAGLPVLRAQIEAVRSRGLKRRPYLAFAGIADSGKFYASLAEAGATVGHVMDFPDHHAFSDADCESILAEAGHRDLVPITTEKDRVRLSGRTGAAQRLAAATETFPVMVRFEEPRRLTALLSDAVAAHRSAYRRRTSISAVGSRVPA